MIKKYYEKNRILKKIKNLLLFYTIFSAAIYADEINLTEENEQYLKPIMEKVMGNNNTCFIENIINKIDKKKKIVADTPLGKAFKLAQFKTDTEKALNEDNLKKINEKIQNNELEINLKTNNNWEKAKLSMSNFFRIFSGGGHSTIKNSQLIEALTINNPDGYSTLKKDDLKYILQTEHKNNYIKEDDSTFNEAAIDTQNFLRNYKTYLLSATAWTGTIIGLGILTLVINPKLLHIFNEFEWREGSGIKRSSLTGIGLLTTWGIPYFSGLLAKKGIVNEIQKHIEGKLLKKENDVYKNITNIKNELDLYFDILFKNETEKNAIIKNIDSLNENFKIEKYIDTINENKNLKNMSDIAWEIISQNALGINELTEEEKESLKKIVINKEGKKEPLKFFLTEYTENIKNKIKINENNKIKYDKVIAEIEALETKENIAQFANNLLMIKKDLIVEE